MKRALLIGALMLAGVTLGCSQPCDVLADTCAKCKDANTKATCDSTVANYRLIPISGQSGCQTVLDAKTFSSCQ